MSAPPPPYNQQGYAPPAQPAYPPPQQGYPPPQQGYPPPQQGYPPPQQGFAPPTQQGYAPPPQGYAPPPQGYAPPAQGYPPQPSVTVVQTVPVQQPTVVHTTIVRNQRPQVNHLLHLLITLIFWPWIIVWIVLCITEGT